MSTTKGRVNPDILEDCPTCHAVKGRLCTGTGDGTILRRYHADRLRATGVPPEHGQERDAYIAALAQRAGVSPYLPVNHGSRSSRPKRAAAAPTRQTAPVSVPIAGKGPHKGNPRPASLVLYTTLRGREVCITLEGQATIEFT